MVLAVEAIKVFQNLGYRLTVLVFGLVGFSFFNIITIPRLVLPNIYLGNEHSETNTKFSAKRKKKEKGG
jgi:hypothetical protein